MLLENQKVSVMWQSQNRDHYQKLGYEFKAYRDIFTVSAEHLSYGSKVEVQVQCDYCFKIYLMTYIHYYKSVVKGYLNKTACFDCMNKKTTETFMKKYGVKRSLQTKEGIEKFRNTVLDKYGVSNISLLEEVQQKKVNTIMEKYGKETYLLTEEYKSRRMSKGSEWTKGRKAHSKLSKSEVIEILKMRHVLNKTYREIHMTFDERVKLDTIRGICNGVNRADIYVSFMESMKT